MCFREVRNQQGRELDMDFIERIKKLKQLGLSQNKISQHLGISKGSVNKYINLENEGKESNEGEKELQKGGSSGSVEEASNGIDFAGIEKELAKKGVTLKLIHGELLSSNPEICSYVNFCRLYRKYKEQQDVCLRQNYKGGEILYVDYSGLTVAVSGYEAEIFVCVLAASNYIYAEASKDQKLVSWLHSHKNAFEFYGGVPKILVPDNLKSGVTKADRYSPAINKSYLEFADYYNCTVIPTRAYSPRDKGKVEVSVQIIQRHILAKLRNEKFNSLQELNNSIKKLLLEVNNMPFSKAPGNRSSLFKELDEPNLTALPAHPYEYAEYEKRTAGRDYHVPFGDKYYSVPYIYARKVVEVKKTVSSIEILYKNQRIAIHPISENDSNKKYITDNNHLPDKHKAFVNCKPEDIIIWAKDNLSPGSVNFIANIISKASTSLETYKISGAIKQLAKQYSLARFDKAATMLAKEEVFYLGSLESVLYNSLESAPPQEQTTKDILHNNLRGTEYYKIHNQGDKSNPDHSDQSIPNNPVQHKQLQLL